MDFTFKYMLLGNSCSGKTSFIKMYTSGIFSNIRDPTIGVDFFTYNDELIFDDKNYSLKFHLFDSGGHKSYLPLLKHYYEIACGIIIMYDCTDVNSYLHAKKWIENRADHFHEYATIILVGNKMEKFGKQILSEEASEFCKLHDIKFFEVSTKNCIGVQEVFDYLNRETLRKIFDKETKVGIKFGIRDSKNILLESNEENRSISKCCMLI